MEDLRNVESNIRNLAAHEIVSVTDETIKNLTGFYGRDIMRREEQKRQQPRRQQKQDMEL